jgi:hypothetical protein
MATACNSSENDSFLTDASFEISEISSLSIHSNGTSNDEVEEENALGVLPYQFEPEYDTDDPAIQMAIEIVNENDPDDETLLTALDSW